MTLRTVVVVVVADTEWVCVVIPLFDRDELFCGDEATNEIRATGVALAVVGVARRLQK